MVVAKIATTTQHSAIAGKTQKITSDFDKLTRQKRYDILTEIADLYYNQGRSLEQELMERYPLGKAIVVSTQYSSYADSCNQVGQVGAAYLNRLLTAHTVLGISWGRPSRRW